MCQSIVAARGDTWLTAEESKRILNAFGVTLVASGAARTEQEATAVASIFGFPVVLKLASSRVLHKTDVGGVRLHLHDEQDVRAAFRDIVERFPDRSSRERRIRPRAAHVDRRRNAHWFADDPTFGPLVAFGLGGVQTEVLHDVAFRIAPLSEHDVHGLIHGIRSFPLLQGYRGQPPADVDALKEILLRVSLLAQHVPELRELDLNPVIALPAGQGCGIVDARARVAALDVQWNESDRQRADFRRVPEVSPMRRVLVVDDEALIRWSLTQTLGDHGFEVEQASCAADALDAVAAFDARFDVVLLDFRLPDSNDLNLLAKLRQLMPRTAVILMTAFSTPEMVQGALDMGAVQVVSKPFEMSDMARLVQQAC